MSRWVGGWDEARTYHAIFHANGSIDNGQKSGGDTHVRHPAAVEVSGHAYYIENDPTPNGDDGLPTTETKDLGGWVVKKIEEIKAVGMRCCRFCMGG